MIFVSHATPEDNEFARWVTLRLAADGFPVWCDLTKLLGGEHFWQDAEAAIRDRTVKFLYVLSRVSNDKEGPRNELQIAKNVARTEQLKNFILPLHTDDLPYGSVNVLLTSINAIPFENGWAQGYARLVEVLERDGVPKSPARFNPAGVSDWWREQFNTERMIKAESEPYLSNWFQITKLPEYLYFHTLRRTKTGLVEPDSSTLPQPGFMDGIDLVTFADPLSLEGRLGNGVSIAQSLLLKVDEILSGSERATQMTKKLGRRWLVRLIVENWNWWIRDPQLLPFKFADSGVGFFFRKQEGDDLELPYVDLDGKARRRSVIGYSTQQNKAKRYWHFGIKARCMLSPYPLLSLSTHVVFSDDGNHIWEDAGAMHRARRRQCKNWHNPEWRDRLLAVLAWLSEGADHLSIPVSTTNSIEVSTRSALFTAPVSFSDPLTRKQRRDASSAEVQVDDEEDLDFEEDGADADEEDDG